MPAVVIRPPSAPRIDAYKVAVKYATDVITGAIVAGKLLKLAAKRFIQDLKFGPARGIVFDRNAAQHVVDFFGTLHHSKGEWGPRAGSPKGDPFMLAPWQVFILANMFGFLRADGTRRFRTAHIEVARKNGKTTLMAGIGLYMLAADGEPGSEVYSVATKKDQAREVFDEAVRMAKKSRALANTVHFSGGKLPTNMSILGTASKFQLQASDYGTADGKNVHCLIADELHQHPTRLLYDAYAQATGSRRQYLIIAITTAGYNTMGVCFAQRSIVENILTANVSVEDGDSFFGYIACIDEGDKDGKGADNPMDESCWAKANPNLGVSVKMDNMREEAAKARIDPSALNSFLCKRLNVWVNQEIRWMDPAKWAACNIAGPLPNPRSLRMAAEKKLEGRIALGALDLSSKFDLSAFALLFPPVPERIERTARPQTRQEIQFRTPVVYDVVVVEPADPRWSVLVWFWVPKDGIPERVKKDRVKYDVWERDGYLLTCPGKVIDHEVIYNHILKAREKYSFTDIAFDSWNAQWISKKLTDSGFKAESCPMTYAKMSEPMKEVFGAVIEKKLEHYGDPILAWNAGNVSATTNANGDVRPDKDKSKEKIDGIVALIMAMSLMCSNPKNATGKGWDYSKGIQFL